MNSWRTVMPSRGYESFDTSTADLSRLGTRPALLVVDVVTSFLGEEGQSLEESIASRPLSCGPSGWAALALIRSLIEAARANEVPVIYTTGNPGVLGGATKNLVDGRDVAQREAQEIPPQIAPAEGEVVIAKSRPSAFFGTPMSALLIQNRVDSLVVCGCTTSGCVRATVVDGHSWGWPVVVAEDACFDRAPLSHDVSLFEMNAKYATVATVAEIAVGIAR